MVERCSNKYFNKERIAYDAGAYTIGAEVFVVNVPLCVVDVRIIGPEESVASGGEIGGD